MMLPTFRPEACCTGCAVVWKGVKLPCACGWACTCWLCAVLPSRLMTRGAAMERIFSVWPRLRPDLAAACSATALELPPRRWPMIFAPSSRSTLLRKEPRLEVFDAAC